MKFLEPIIDKEEGPICPHCYHPAEAGECNHCNLRLVLPCKHCGDFPKWADLDDDHLWTNMRHAKWEGWLAHECKAKYYALAGAKKFCYEDWNIQQKGNHDI